MVQEELAKKKKRQKKVRISADGTPYTVWQTRTRILCLIYLVWALLEIAVGAGFLTIRSIGLFDPTELVPNITFGGSTVLSGVFNLIIALKRELMCTAEARQHSSGCCPSKGDALSQ